LNTYLFLTKMILFLPEKKWQKGIEIRTFLKMEIEIGRFSGLFLWE